MHQEWFVIWGKNGFVISSTHPLPWLTIPYANQIALSTVHSCSILLCMSSMACCAMCQTVACTLGDVPTTWSLAPVCSGLPLVDTLPTVPGSLCVLLSWVPAPKVGCGQV